MRAPMPGLVKLVRAAKGDAVSKGQPLLVLEAMKMEHTIAAPHDGVIAEIVAEGAQVTDGTVLVRFEEATRPDERLTASRKGRDEPGHFLDRAAKRLLLDRRVFAVVPEVDVVGGVLDVALLVEGDRADDGLDRLCRSSAPRRP